MTESQLAAWLILSFTPQLGGVSLSRLLRIDSPENIVAYNTLELQNLKLKPAQIQFIQQQSHPEVDACLTWYQAQGNHIITPLDQTYPPLLLQMSSHPPVLFVKGNIDALIHPQIAMVGSRNASMDGLRAAREFGYQLAEHGLTVTSGLALGIDGHAHDGALQAKGETVAVLGSGVDQIYPARHKGLAQRILESEGALVSEFRPDTKPRAEYFPRRNRIVSGLSFGVLVVEAAERSGSLITARYALEQNREVFALPGSIYQAGHAGSNGLIQQGASLVCSAQDIIDEIQPQLDRSSIITTPTQPSFAFEIEKESSCENTLSGSLPFAELLANVGNEPTPVDILAQRTHIPVHEVMMQILELELSGYVASVPGGYILNSRPK
ncbi:DNA-protecting protein DprA [Vibrio sp. S11_S32]|uniref:DNA-processing protein DprA n=1 Tax=Vibrio sp. S11_S32 TaxID=2720225 RepID=UPI001681C0C5|nr:DNA-processing protein DprA [Vibrio sp. S11_S32]MBD1577304.1 DNA-protecting protein DprA [Vibrio sp. S11_S32]